MDPTEIIQSQAEAAHGILEEFGAEKALGYLIGEKFLNFLGVAETDRQWREAITTFVTEIKTLFEPYQLVEYLNTPRRLGALGHVASDEAHQLLREALDESEKARGDAAGVGEGVTAGVNGQMR
jgi:hypothetical protein